jgi:hypothetical protein
VSQASGWEPFLIIFVLWSGFAGWATMEVNQKVTQAEIRLATLKLRQDILTEAAGGPTARAAVRTRSILNHARVLDANYGIAWVLSAIAVALASVTTTRWGRATAIGAWAGSVSFMIWLPSHKIYMLADKATDFLL